MEHGPAHPVRGARCGLDLIDVIDESPHGKSKLRLLKKVGSLDGEDARSGAR